MTTHDCIGVWALEDGKQLLLKRTDKGVEFIFDDIGSLKVPKLKLTIEKFRLNNIVEFIKVE